ncbi:MAG: hypothetical protein DRI90_25145 [Deltaproteobacteria bacterium]|nr:MAG: hypothetical protein DRI90_25145 [Deltaproteobacteria bacterium]
MESMVLYDLGTKGSSDASSTSYQQFEPDLDLVSEGAMEVVWVQSDTLPQPGTAGAQAPMIINDLTPLTIRTPRSVRVLQIDYTDPFGCRPNLCTFATSAHQSYFLSPCTPMKGDGYVVGRTYLGWRYESVPERTTEVLEVAVVPVSGPGCPDLLDHASSGDGSFDDPLVLASSALPALVAGKPKATSITIVSEEEATSSSSSSSGGGACDAYVIKCGEVVGGIETVGGVVPESCPCPSGTYQSGVDNVTAGGPYRICSCN